MSLLTLVRLLSDGIGESDCELLRDEALAQPVNALTSLTYSMVGVVVVVRARIRHRPLLPAAVYGLCLVGIGVGSVLFHGPQPEGSRVLHDLPILLTVVFIVTHDLGLVWNRVRRPMIWFVAGALVATTLTLIDLNLGAAATGVGVAALATLEFIIYRRRMRPASTRRQRQGYWAIIGIATVAAGTWLLGRTDSPVCDPDAAFQFHGLWHLLSALVFGLWWWLAFDSDDGPSRPEGPVTASTSGVHG